MPDSPSLLVAILAAGASRRLGRPKQLVELSDGEPLIRRQCRVAIEADVGPVLAVLGCEADACVAALGGLPMMIRMNAEWEEGLASSVRVAAQAARDATAAGLLILHGDQYRVSADDLRSLHAAWERAGESKGCRARDADYAGPPVILPAECLRGASKLDGEEGARGILAALGPDGVIDVPMPNARFDLDRPEQLEDLARVTRARPAS
jgi:CTP:molybdopterin cytidylyltransferase MocA